MLGKKVKNIEIKKGEKVSDLVNAFSESGGFTAKKLAIASDIFKDMQRDSKCVKFLSFPADVISTGLRGVIVDLVKNKLVDVIITTCGTLDHDLAKVWKDYYAGTEMSDDAKLRQEGINRLYNIFIPNDSYGYILEDKLIPILKEAAGQQKEYSTSELISFIGSKISKEKNAKESIVFWAWKNNIPIKKACIPRYHLLFLRWRLYYCRIWSLPLLLLLFRLFLLTNQRHSFHPLIPIFSFFHPKKEEYNNGSSIVTSPSTVICFASGLTLPQDIASSNLAPDRLPSHSTAVVMYIA